MHSGPRNKKQICCDEQHHRPWASTGQAMGVWQWTLPWSIINLLCPQLKSCQMRGPREREESIAVCKLWDLQSLTCKVRCSRQCHRLCLTESGGEQSHWLGGCSGKPVWRQSCHLAVSERALNSLLADDPYFRLCCFVFFYKPSFKRLQTFINQHCFIRWIFFLLFNHLSCCSPKSEE